MQKLIIIAHISLDRFVAGPNGELDGFEKGEENLDYICKLTEQAEGFNKSLRLKSLLECFL